MSFPYKLIFANLWLFKPLLVKILPKISASAGEMLGTSCYFTTINGGKYSQIQAKKVEATVFLRCVDDNDLKKDIEAVKKIADKYGIEITNGDDAEYHKPADMNKPEYGFVRECIKKVFPDAAVAPFILSAGSDARHMTDICPCVIRFAPIDISPEQFSSVHNPNENINIQSVGEAVSFYKEVIRGYK